MSRILIADDQPDVLEALRILLKGEGYQIDVVTSLGAVLNSLEKRTYALLMMDLNYTRDTTSGQEGLETIPRIQALDDTLPDRRHDRLGDGRSRGRGDETRRARFRHQALG